MKEYRNVSKTKNAIKKALLTLLQTKEISIIGVSDIVKLADISRGTFYNHYNNVVDVIKEVEQELMQLLVDSINLTIKQNYDVSIFITQISKHIAENEKVYKQITTYTFRELLFDLKGQILQELETNILKTSNIKITKFQLSFLANALAGVYIDYLEDRLSISLEELNQQLVVCLNSTFEVMKKNN